MIELHNIGPSGITMKVSAIKESRTATCYLIFPENLHQRIMLRIMSRFACYQKWLEEEEILMLY